MNMPFRQSTRLISQILLLPLLFGCGSEKEVEVVLEPVSEEVTIPNGVDSLGGTLSMPGGAGPHPAVVLISGSGPQDRDGAMRAVPGYTPFREIAAALNAKGIAVLRYDDRGVGKSTGNYIESGEADFVSDAGAAVDYLLSREEIDSQKIGLIGHSEGAMIAAQVSLNNRYVSFIVSLAGGATEGRELLIKQTERITRAEGVSGAAVEEAIRDQNRIFDLVEAQDWENLEKLITEVTLKSLEKVPLEQLAMMGDPELLARRKAAQSRQSFQHPRYQYLLAHDNSEDWRQVRVPVLGIFGELDVQCDAEQNSTALKAALEAGGNTDFEIVILPGMNHLLIRAQTGSPREYTTLPKQLMPELLETVAGWLDEQL